MARWPIPAQTAALQMQASDPAASAWVHANAGSGKTYVLAQRVVRLLLAGVDPSKILCLTFTKAAAANMSIRVFDILSRWTAMDDAGLSAALIAIGAQDSSNLKRARKLFAHAVETPGGLKIQTIHAFCERILHLFPFEANVPAHFEGMDEQRQRQLMEEARLETMHAASHEQKQELTQALQVIAAEASGRTFDELIRDAIKLRESIHTHGALPDSEFAKALGARLGLMPGDNPETMIREILEGGISPARWMEIVVALKESGVNDAKLANSYQLSQSATRTKNRLDHYLSIFFTGKGEPRKGLKGRLLKKTVDDSIEADIQREMTRVVTLTEKLSAAHTVARSVALHRVAREVLTSYARLKQMRGLLDFDDLVDRTCNLLSRSDAAWVLYKLDAGIEHILVDEAQDTSPQQWRILTELAGEFFAGEGARKAVRTFFVVGDEKQSIFSFQGAAPREFGLNARSFAGRINNAKMQFADVRLTVSFRSASEILSGVDKVFGIPANYKGLSLDDEVSTVHQAWKSDLPGLIEIWKPVAALEKPGSDGWLMPVNAPPEHSPASILAKRIAAKIQSLLHPVSKEAVHDDAGQLRPIRGGDIMILVRRRNAFFDAVIRELKIAGVPVAGADRLKLMEHIAIMDLVAAGRAALLPQDDFTLACLLKSPLFSFTDDDLLTIAPNREGSLFTELRNSVDARLNAAHDRIARWRDTARDLGPFRFFAHILNAEDGRRAMLARLGEEAGDAIDEFLRLALQWERDNPASLTAFLQQMQNADIEIKRDMEAAGASVRVMTVHAAKGLEAKIVFLPDTCAALSPQHEPKLIKFAIGDDVTIPVWRTRTKDNPQAIKGEMTRLREEQRDEYRRLLYVAMTRAEERLYISGYHGVKGRADGCWYDMISQTLGPVLWDETEIHRIGTSAMLAEEAAATQANEPEATPGWLFEMAPVELAPHSPLRPSHALAAADQLDITIGGAGDPGRELAMLEGNLCHVMLQYLPALEPHKRPDAGLRFLADRGRALGSERRDALLQQTLNVIAHPALAILFGPGSRAEIAIAARIPKVSGGEIDITGRIDRIGHTASEVLIADFKTGAPLRGTAIPKPYLAQMALYTAGLKPLFPGKTIRALIIWTGGPQITELSSGSLDEVLAELTA